MSRVSYVMHVPSTHHAWSSSHYDATYHPMMMMMMMMITMPSILSASEKEKWTFPKAYVGKKRTKEKNTKRFFSLNFQPKLCFFFFCFASKFQNFCINLTYMSVRKPKELREINTREYEYSTNSTTSQALVNLIEKIICSSIYMSINLIHNLRNGYYSKYHLQMHVIKGFSWNLSS